MVSVATQGLLGQPLDVVESYLGPTIHHQANPQNQTDFYVHGTQYLRGVFPVVLAGIISVYRQNQCIALRIVLSKRHPGYDTFVYNREMASRLYQRVISNDYTYWSEIEASPQGNNCTHFVYCLGGNVATTWDASAIDQTLKSDIVIYLDTRCGVTDHSVVSQPIVSPVGAVGLSTPSEDSGSGTPGSESAGEPRPAKPLTFTDIDGNLYETAILKAANTYHLIAGYEDKTFKPENPVPREQAIKLLIGAMQQMMADPAAIALPDDLTTAPFADVPIDHKSAREFYYAKQAGILAGDKQNRAHPEAHLNRAGLMVIVHSALKVVVKANYSAGTSLSDVIKTITTPQPTFTDIDDHWGETAIREMATYGIATPYKEQGTEFQPATEAHRDYLAAILVRMLEVEFNQLPGLETKPKPVKVFPDIGNNRYKEEIIKAANQYSIVAGYEDGKFHPTDKLSREQAVTLLINTMQQMVKDPDAIQIPEKLSDPPPFEDVQAGGSATKIQFAKTAGLVSGDKNGWFRPLDTVSRAQLMAMIRNGLEFVVKANLGEKATLADAIASLDKAPQAFTDVPDSHWVKNILADINKTGIATPYGETGQEFKPDQPAQRDYTAAAMVRMVETPLAVSASAKPAERPGFTDIEGNPFEPEILQAANPYQLVAGYEDGTFKPSAPVSREQAVTIIIDALRQRLANKQAVVIPDELTQPPFTDVASDRWSATRLYFAKQAGIIAGDKNGRFFPAEQLGRAQLMAIVYQALSYAVWADFGRQIALDRIFTPGTVDTYSFDDIPNNHWAVGIMPTMSILGLALPLDPEAPEKFAPDKLAQRDYTVATAVHMIQLAYTETPQPLEEITFLDISSSPYAAEILQAANQYHIVSGAADGNFHPRESIHREHVVSMLVDVLQQMMDDPAVVEVPGQLTSAPFRDVPTDSLFATKIKFVADAKIMSGDKDTGLFRPKNDLTRAELMAIIDNALKFIVRHNYGEETEVASVIDTANITPPEFSDVDDAHWAKDAINRLAALGIALPRDAGSNQFWPNEPSRRDFAAASMVHLLELSFREKSES
jgi:hypothetical protein